MVEAPGSGRMCLAELSWSLCFTAFERLSDSSAVIKDAQTFTLSEDPFV
jgi:hypothetical protein